MLCDCKKSNEQDKIPTLALLRSFTYIFMNRTDKSWRWMAPLGLVLTGMGLSIIGEAIILKGDEVEIWKWVLMGTLGLACFNAGLSVFGDAVKRRMWSEWHLREGSEENKTPNI